MPRFEHLPPGTMPILVGRDTAAALLGVGTTKFDELVRRGLLPAPVECDALVRWPTDELREAAKRLPRRGEPSADPGADWMVA